jgi:DinB superfamily
MIHIANALQTLMAAALPKLRAISEQRANGERRPGKWNRKEILGHLIDSAANNQQRFIRARQDDPMVFPGYDQNLWVESHAYRTRSWSELIDVWTAYNAQVAQLISTTPANRRAVACRIGGGDDMTLEMLMQDYLKHLEHHLAQIVATES